MPHLSDETGKGGALNSGGVVAEPGFELVFAVVGGDEEGLVEDGDAEEAVGVLVSGGDAHLGDLALGASESDSLLFLELGGGCGEFGFGEGDLDH
jgi:hypothetical protein